VAGWLRSVLARDADQASDGRGVVSVAERCDLWPDARVGGTLRQKARY
jgi:hypothetical protein